MEIKDPVGPLLYASFNMQSTRLCVGTRTGFMIFQVDPFQRLFRSDTGGCSIVQVLDEKPLVVTVGSGEHITSSRRVVKLYALKQQKPEICRLAFETPVLGVKITSQRLVVITESEIHIYNTEQLSFLTKISTSPNPKGLCSVFMQEGNVQEASMLLAYSCLRGPLKGDLILYDLVGLTQRRKIEGIHNHPLQNIQFSRDGLSVATASEEGTLIKITSLRADDSEPTCVFRRGMLARADISSIAFNNDNTLLAVSSTNGTTHIFDIITEQEKHKQTKSTFGMLAGFVVGEETRSFCTIRLPNGTQNIVTFSNDSRRIHSITQDGKLSQWQIPDTVPLGWGASLQSPTCKLVREYDLLSEYTYCDDEFDTVEAR
eukprot:TRINITY_DN15222_c0_g1_i1.p1 TRINITY_DN15222_c0_g1~~TRINITY_DN15222_c0_g1_i1.p1  ORF type:complete len:373 (-),score=43.64 TRINITY_DN15222_c0_g1_i1:97-1215(-)